MRLRRIEQERVATGHRRAGLAHVDISGHGATIEAAVHLEIRLDLLACDAKRALQVAHKQIAAKVRRHRIEPTEGNDSRTRGSSFLVISVDQRFHPNRLAGDVDIVRPQPYTGIDDRAAVRRERPGDIQQHARTCDHGVHCRLIGAVSGQHVYRRCACESRLDRFELLPISSADSPTQLAALRVPSEVLRRSAADEARRAVDHNIVITIHHGHENGTRVAFRGERSTTGEIGHSERSVRRVLGYKLRR